MVRSRFVGFVAALVVASSYVASLYGCATPANQGGEVKEARDQPVYRTGSNLPVKDPGQRGDVGTMSAETYQNQAQPALIRPQLPTPTGK